MTLDAALGRLIDHADRMLNRGGAADADYEELVAEITAGGIVGDEARMLVVALRNVTRSDRANAWAMVAAALLVMVRAALGRAVEARRLREGAGEAEAARSAGKEPWWMRDEQA